MLFFVQRVHRPAPASPPARADFSAYMQQAAKAVLYVHRSVSVLVSLMARLLNRCIRVLRPNCFPRGCDMLKYVLVVWVPFRPELFNLYLPATSDHRESVHGGRPICFGQEIILRLDFFPRGAASVCFPLAPHPLREPRLAGHREGEGGYWT